MLGSFHFSFFGQSDQKTKRLAVIFGQNAFFYTKNKQTGKLISLFLVLWTKKGKKKNGMNRTFMLLFRRAYFYERTQT